MTAEDKRNKVQHRSITSRVTVYHIEHRHIVNHFGHVSKTGNVSQCCINLIDVPGFADVGGVEKDILIYEMISVILKQIESLDYVFLVAKSDTQRVNHQVKHTYEKIQNLYAEDIKPRICGIFTYSEGKKDKVPPIVAALGEVGIQIDPEKRFEFNNTALYNRYTDFTSEVEKYMSTAWKFRVSSFDKLRGFMRKQALSPAV